MEDEEERFKGAWKRVWDGTEYLHAREGDHLITPFECDLCIFLKLKGRYPNGQMDDDRKVVACIRRMNLDAFWSRASTTVGNNLRLARNLINLPKSVGLSPPFVSHGPMPDFDHCGYKVAVSMLLMSLKPGRYDKSYTQFETIRHLRSCYNNFERISTIHATDHLLFPTQVNQENHQNITNSIWFRRFYAGSKSRMGQVVKPNLALSTELIIRVLDDVLVEVHRSEAKDQKFECIVFGAYVVIGYVLSLRGSEGLMVNLSTINRELQNNRDHCIIALKGKVKGETIDRDHLFPCSKKTVSGINVERWLKMLSTAHKMAGRNGGPAITNWSGDILTINQIDSKLHESLSNLFEEKVEFPHEIKTVDDIFERFSAFRSLRRASNTRAIERNVSANDIDVINRWKTIEAAKGRKASQSMRQHYTEISALKAPFLRYTFQM